MTEDNDESLEQLIQDDGEAKDTNIPAIGLKRKAPNESDDLIKWMDWLDEGEGAIGRRNACRHMKQGRMSQLLGWATNPQRQRLITNEYTPPPSTLSALDPFMHHSTPPPKPSHLVLLTASAQKKIQQSTPTIRQVRSRPKQISTFKCQEYAMSDSSSLEVSSDDEDDEDDSTFNLFENFHPKTHIKIHTPIMTVSSQPPTNMFDPRKIYNTINETGVVALGMIIQESLTAMLLPLARRHVSRCRMVDKRKRLDASRVISKHQSFHDPLVPWTQSPSEAIVNMARDIKTTNPPSYLLSSIPPTRRTLDSNNEDGKQGDKIQDATYFLNTWCQRHELDPLFVSKNMNLFHLFLTDTPPILSMKPPSTIQSDALRDLLYKQDPPNVWAKNVLYPS